MRSDRKTSKTIFVVGALVAIVILCVLFVGIDMG
jgi:hypothetical protein